MDDIKYKKIDKSKLVGRKSKIMTSKEALKDIIPIDWGKEPYIAIKKRWIYYKILEKKYMCQLGDIILINEYKDRKTTLKKHSFVVIDDEKDKINGLSFDMICNVMSSFKNADQKERKLKYPGNFPIIHGDSSVPRGNEKDGYIKADQMYYFNKSEIDYKVIGSVSSDVFNLLLEFIQDSNFDIIEITDNLV